MLLDLKFWWDTAAADSTTLADGWKVLDAYSVSPGLTIISLAAAAAEDLTLSETSDAAIITAASVAENLVLAESSVGSLLSVTAVAETVVLTEASAALLAPGLANSTESVTLTDSSTALLAPGVTSAAENVVLTDVSDRAIITPATIAENVGLLDVSDRTITTPASVAENVILTDFTTDGWLPLDSYDVTPFATMSAEVQNVAENIVLADAVAGLQTSRGAATDDLVLGELTVASTLLVTAVTENVALSETSSCARSANAAAAEDVVLTDSTAALQISRGVVGENVALTDAVSGLSILPTAITENGALAETSSALQVARGSVVETITLNYEAFVDGWKLLDTYLVVPGFTTDFAANSAGAVENVVLGETSAVVLLGVGVQFENVALTDAVAGIATQRGATVEPLTLNYEAFVDGWKLLDAYLVVPLLFAQDSTGSVAENVAFAELSAALQVSRASVVESAVLSETGTPGAGNHPVSQLTHMGAMGFGVRRAGDFTGRAAVQVGLEDVVLTDVVAGAKVTQAVISENVGLDAVGLDVSASAHPVDQLTRAGAMGFGVRRAGDFSGKGSIQIGAENVGLSDVSTARLISVAARVESLVLTEIETSLTVAVGVVTETVVLGESTVGAQLQVGSYVEAENQLFLRETTTPQRTAPAAVTESVVLTDVVVGAQTAAAAVVESAQLNDASDWQSGTLVSSGATESVVLTDTVSGTKIAVAAASDNLGLTDAPNFVVLSSSAAVESVALGEVSSCRLIANGTSAEIISLAEFVEAVAFFKAAVEEGVFLDDMTTSGRGLLRPKIGYISFFHKHRTFTAQTSREFGRSDRKRKFGTNG